MHLGQAGGEHVQLLAALVFVRDSVAEVCQVWMRIIYQKETHHVSKVRIIYQKETHHVSKVRITYQKETHHVSKETYEVSKETYAVSKETFHVTKETYAVSKEAYGYQKRPAKLILALVSVAEVWDIFGSMICQQSN